MARALTCKVELKDADEFKAMAKVCEQAAKVLDGIGFSGIQLPTKEIETSKLKALSDAMHRLGKHSWEELT